MLNVLHIVSVGSQVMLGTQITMKNVDALYV